MQAPNGTSTGTKRSLVKPVRPQRSVLQATVSLTGRHVITTHQSLTAAISSKLGYTVRFTVSLRLRCRERCPPATSRHYKALCTGNTPGGDKGTAGSDRKAGGEGEGEEEKDGVGTLPGDQYLIPVTVCDWSTPARLPSLCAAHSQ